jgi:hypothetical protein
MLLASLLTIYSQVDASESYHKLMNIIRNNMSTVQFKPHDLVEYKAKVLVVKDDVYGDQEEILELSDTVFNLVSALTEQEKAKLPRISIATPGTFAMKFYCRNGCCSQKFITTERPTVDDLDRKSREVKF